THTNNHTLTTENFPSPNHMTQRVPSAARLRPAIHQDNTLPGHPDKARSFPHTSSPMPNPQLSCNTRQHNTTLINIHKDTHTHTDTHIQFPPHQLAYAKPTAGQQHNTI